VTAPARPFCEADEESSAWVIEQSGSLLVPEGAHQLGYELRDGGLRVVLSRELPSVVQSHLRGAVDGFLQSAGLLLSDIDFVAAHPGGLRIFDAIERSLELTPGGAGCLARGLYEIWECLERGNLLCPGGHPAAAGEPLAAWRSRSGRACRSSWL